MFNRKIEITKENESILFINAVIENLRYAIISLDAILNGGDEFGDYYDEHTFYFFHIQSILTAQGNIYNVLFNAMGLKGDGNGKTKKLEYYNDEYILENLILLIKFFYLYH